MVKVSSGGELFSNLTVGHNAEPEQLQPEFEFEKFGIGIEEIRRDAEELASKNSTYETIGLFTVMPARKWIDQAKTRPIPKMLFDEFWLEGEICILFADTNLGKSILAVQIGNSVSLAEPIAGFKIETKKQIILYFDFELSDKQFENRYSCNFQQHYEFDDNFIRIEINTNADVPDKESFEDYLNYSLEQAILRTGSKVLIIDNLTYLRNETEKAKDALPLMKQLKRLKNKYHLSILALAHTPKRDFTKPITRNDLQGSKMLMSFTDVAFTIGESQKDKNIRYLKQIKVRQNEFNYDGENVCVCKIGKPHNFLAFEFIGNSTEREHLKEIPENEKAQKIADAVNMKKQGLTNTEIAMKFGVSEGAIRKWLKKATETNII